MIRVIVLSFSSWPKMLGQMLFSFLSTYENVPRKVCFVVQLVSILSEMFFSIFNYFQLFDEIFQSRFHVFVCFHIFVFSIFLPENGPPARGRPPAVLKVLFSFFSLCS